MRTMQWSFACPLAKMQAGPREREREKEKKMIEREKGREREMREIQTETKRKRERKKDKEKKKERECIRFYTFTLLHYILSMEWIHHRSTCLIIANLGCTSLRRLPHIQLLNSTFTLREAEHVGERRSKILNVMRMK